MKILKYIGIGLVILFALIGLASVAGYLAVTFHWTNVKGIIDPVDRKLTPEQGTTTTISGGWNKTEEWQTLQVAIRGDKPMIDKVAAETDINARLLVAPLVVEQMRLFTTQREIFKDIFKPLQILGIQSQFSWGVMGLKQETAIQIEKNLKDPQSPYYLGPKYEHLLDFTVKTPGDAQDTERFDRIVARDHYYSYLYTAVFLKQIMTEWQKAGFPIEDRPEILATLFNIGFEHSNPKENPQSGGAEIEINGSKYSFGRLAGEFYWSNELLNEFPRK